MLRLCFAVFVGLLVSFPSLSASASDCALAVEATCSECNGQCGPCACASGAVPCVQSCGGACCGSHGCGLHGLCTGKGCCCCEMSQHYHYYPEMHGYYYLRPYNWTLISEQEQATAGWGEDPRNPWGRQVFERVYAEYLAEKGSKPDPFVTPGALPAPQPLQQAE